MSKKMFTRPKSWRKLKFNKPGGWFKHAIHGIGEGVGSFANVKYLPGHGLVLGDHVGSDPAWDQAEMNMADFANYRDLMKRYQGDARGNIDDIKGLHQSDLESRRDEIMKGYGRSGYGSSLENIIGSNINMADLTLKKNIRAEEKNLKFKSLFVVAGVYLP